MFPTPPSLEQHAAFSPIMTYRDTPSHEPVGPSVGQDQSGSSQSNNQLADFKMEVEEDMTSTKAEDVRLRV